MNKTPGIYCITNTVTNKVYIGSTINLHRRHLAHLRSLKANKHHSQKLQRAWNKYGEEAFTFIVLVECDKVLLSSLEQFFIDKLDAYSNGYNGCSLAGYNPALYKGAKTGHNCSEETKAKISASNLGKIKKPLSEEHKEKLRQKQLGRKLTEEDKLKVSLSKLGKPRSEETKAKLSAYRTGLKIGPHSEETKAKIGLSNKGKHSKPHSEETKRKISLSNKGKHSKS